MNTYGIRPSKRAGQNFLHNPQTAKRFVETMDKHITNDPNAVVEIGPGLGAITQHLCDRFERVFAIEKDKRLIKHWAGIDKASNLEIIEGDATNYDFAKLAKQVGHKLIVFGNLPFNVSTQILERLIQQWQHIDKALLTFQKEVAERIVAKPSTKDYGSLTVLADTYCNVSHELFIGKGEYYPVPKIDSKVVLFDFLDEPRVARDDLKDFERFVRQTFLYRRKTLLNGVKQSAFSGWHALIKSYFDQNKISATCRIETWTRQEMYDLFEYCKKAG